MLRSCGAGGCPANRIWALMRPDGKCARFSFSRSVLEWANQGALGGVGHIQRLQFRLGLPLEPGQSSRSGIYAIVAAQGSNGSVLRVCYTEGAAALFADPGARSVAEFWLVPEQALAPLLAEARCAA